MDARPATLDLLLRVMKELRRNYDARAEELGLTFARTRVLTTLANLEGATQTELALALQIEAPTLKRQIDSLEKLGFIERRGMNGDARKRALHLTEKARGAGLSLFVQAVRSEIFEGVSPEDMAAMDRALQRMITNATRIGERWKK